MSAQIEKVRVLIAGAGPAGLVAAGTLGRYGVDVLVVDSRAEPSRVPRATSVSTATMELFRSWGLEEMIRAGDVKVSTQALMTETLALAEHGAILETGFPSLAQSAVIGPVAPAAVPQDHVEPILEGYARSLPSVRIDREVSVVGVEQEEDGVLVRLADARHCRERLVRAEYLVGADGIRSTVRDALEIGSESTGPLGERLAVLLRGPLWDVAGHENRYTIYLTPLEGEPFFLPVGVPDRWVFGMTWDFETTPLSEISHEAAMAEVRRAAGVPDLGVEIERIQHVTYEVALADSFRRGRGFLVGDAAHRVTPRGGTGMNTAIRDGFDLGWKLGWVLRGWAGEELLDTYELERRPVAEHNARRSSDPTGSLRPASEELSTDLGGRMAHVWVAEGRSTLDMLGPGLTLFTSEEVPGPEPARADGPPLESHRLSAMASRALGVTPGTSLLVRPDGMPAGILGAMPVGLAPVRGKEATPA